MKIIAEKKFNKSDQNKFAKYSSDYNPIHLKKIEARKYISGECIVHGINSLLWAFENFYIINNFLYQNIEVNFKNFISLNSKISLCYDKKNNILLITNIHNLIMVEIRFKGKKIYNSNNLIFFNHNFINQNKPSDFNLTNFDTSKSISSFIIGDYKLGKILYPILSKKFGENFCSEIALLSSIVGMQVPGLNSLFSQLSLTLVSKRKQQSTLKFKQFDDRFKLIKLSYLGMNIIADINAFYRPKPIEIMTILDIKKKLNLDLKYSDKNILIIGGSRGLGAWCAKTLSAQGANVYLTYNLGKDDAFNIKKDINSFGGLCEISHYNINSNISALFKNINFFQIYYFATPKIFNKKSINFDKKLYKKFLLFYHDKFFEILSFYKDKGVKYFFYPSTIAINQHFNEIEEYISAKKKGEDMCETFIKHHDIYIYKPRLKRFLSDQTNTILSSNSNDPLRMAYAITKKMLHKSLTH